ncbi:hypothetical protein P3T76_009768 [Phytophthora citrophthora]|uniref:Uncharacterized protein n=1 Tax=Phytophthora citrophthora TaxID=4793 RepID=A0AAD9GEU6_9STRA|nr:hypothetical protein P3T76_009768 [Phytophthora citrophthora]
MAKLESEDQTSPQVVDNREECDSIETLKHCYLTCPELTPIQWRKAFRSALEWKLLLFPSNRDVARGWRDDQDYLLLLRRIHTAIVFHATWRLRNDIYFGKTQAMSSSIASVQASFRSHYHFLFRHSSDWNIDDEALNRVLRRLGVESEQTELLPNLPRQRIWTPRSQTRDIGNIIGLQDVVQLKLINFYLLTNGIDNQVFHDATESVAS